MNRNRILIWISRAMIMVVLFFNVFCALLFLTRPASYTAAYELSGEVGAVVIRGFGILFLMWNVPYLLAVIHPVRNFISLLEALTMQFIALAGESWIWVNLSEQHWILRKNIGRFIVFDLLGLILLGSAFGLMLRIRNIRREKLTGEEESALLQ